MRCEIVLVRSAHALERVVFWFLAMTDSCVNRYAQHCAALPFSIDSPLAAIGNGIEPGIMVPPLRLSRSPAAPLRLSPTPVCRCGLFPFVGLYVRWSPPPRPEVFAGAPLFAPLAPAPAACNPLGPCLDPLTVRPASTAPCCPRLAAFRGWGEVVTLGCGDPAFARGFCRLFPRSVPWRLRK